jgi:phage-related protein
MRQISWLKAVRKEFETFPHAVKEQIKYALSVVSEGQYPDKAKPLQGFSEGVYEIALSNRGDAWRTVYAVKLGQDIWVLHAFQKKSTQGIKTSKHDIDLIHSRIKQLKDQLR